MVKLKPSDVLFWVLASLTTALLLGFLLVLGGAIPVESPGSAAETEETASTQAEPVVTEERAPETTATVAAVPSRTTTEKTATAPAPQLTTVVITASRGDCWIQARLSSETGRLLDERVLAEGESVRVRGRQVWLSVGASGNVDVTVNGQPRPLPTGTIEVVLGPAT